MIEKLIKNYGSLCDSWIDEISIKKIMKDSIEKVIISVEINSANIIKDYKYEKICLVFEEVLCFTFKDNTTINLSPKEVYINYDNNTILFDFDPIDNFDSLEENNDSNFKIISKILTFEIIS